MSENHSGAGAKATLLKNTGLLAIGKFSSQLITFLMLPVYTTYLPPSEYGVVDLIVTYVALLAPALTIQMEMAVFRFLIETRKGTDAEKSLVISNAFLIAIVTIITFSFLASIAHLFFDIPYFGIVVAVLISAVICGLCLQAARGLGKNSHYAIASIITGLSTVISSLVLVVMLKQGAFGILVTMLISYLMAAIYLIFALKLFRYLRFNALDRGVRRELVKYAAPLVPNGVAWWVINAADRTIILIMLGLTANGIYAIASRFPLIFSALFSVFGMSWTESASVHINSPHRDRFFSEIFDSAFRFFGSIGLGLIASVPLVFPILVDEKYAEALIYIPVMILGPIFSSIVGLYSAIYVAKKLTRQVASTSIIAMIISVSVNLALIQFIGLFAAAIANSAAFLSMAIYRHYDVKKYVRVAYDKILILVLTLFYATVTVIYYMDILYLNIASLLVVSIFAYWLNRNTLRFILKRAGMRSRSKESVKPV